MKNKKGMEASFAWIFAIAIGAVILFVAIYGVVKLIGTEKTVQSSEAAKQLGIILTPAETSFEELQVVPPIKFPSETRVYNNCTTDGRFGEQMLSVSQSSGIGQKWPEPGVPSTFYNKYIFSRDIVQGTKLYVFSKPFERPFRIADPIFMWTGEYCLINPPNEINEDMKYLDKKGINITSSIVLCSKKSKKVCFNSQLDECDVFIDSVRQIAVWKEGYSGYYEGSLVYGAMFSTPEIYECQVKRLMMRASELSLVYLEKSKNLAARAAGCSSNLQADLTDYSAKAKDINTSFMLSLSYYTSESLRTANNAIIDCKLWGSQ